MKKKKKNSFGKKQAIRIHAIRRLEERHTTPMSLLAIVVLNKTIRDQNHADNKRKCQFVDRQSNRVTRWHVWYENKWYPVVYDKKRNEIITVLPDFSLGNPPPPFTAGRV